MPISEMAKLSKLSFILLARSISLSEVVGVRFGVPSLMLPRVAAETGHFTREP
jgi:hypothetical protein